jgi:hypothetical protein
MLPSRARQGITIVEILVVIGIIGLLIALGLPAIQQARETSRRTSCLNNLTQFGKSLHGYESAHRVFPAAYRDNKTGWHAPHVHLLPYFERRDLYTQINPSEAEFVVPSRDPAHFGQEHVTAFACPSDIREVLAGTSYRVCTGPGLYSFGLGAFEGIGGRAASAYTDGLSMTVAMSEKLLGGGNATRYSSREDFWYSGASATGFTPDLDQMISICDSLSGPPVDFYPYAGFAWRFAGYENTWYNHTVSPNSPICDCVPEPYIGPAQSPTSGGVFKASSFHPGGVNCLLMDGSTRFVADSIDLAILLGSRTTRTRESG